MPEHLEILRLRPVGRAGGQQAGQEALALERHLRHAADHRRRRHAQDLKHGRNQVAGVGEPLDHLAAAREALGPGDHQRVADAAAVGVLLVAAQRGVGGHGPAQREVRVAVRPADVLQARQFLLERLGLAVVGAHRVDEAVGAALLAGAVVGHHQDQGIVADAGRLKESYKPGELAVGVVEHGGERALEADRHLLLVGREVRPRSHPVVAGRHVGGGRDQAHGLLPRQPALALHVPAFGEDRVVALDDGLWRLVGRVAGARREPQEPGRLRRVGRVIGDVADRLVHQVGGQVVALGVALRLFDRGVVAHQLRRILVGLGVHESVVAVEAPAQRPAVEGARGAGLAQRGHVPLADHVVAVAVRPQHLRQGPGFLGDLAAVAREAGIEVGQAPHPHRMVVAAGEQRRTGRRTHGGGVEAVQPHAGLGQGVDGRRPDRRAVAAEVRESDVVEQHHQDVGRRLRDLRRGRPIGRGVRQGSPDLRRHSVIPIPVQRTETRSSGVAQMKNGGRISATAA